MTPLNGYDYFQEDSDSPEYFDSSSYMEYPEIGTLSAIRSAPVFLDPYYSRSQHPDIDMSDSSSFGSGAPAAIPYPTKAQSK